MTTRIAFWPELIGPIKEVAEAECPPGYRITWFPRDTPRDELCAQLTEFDYLLGFPFRPTPENYDALAHLKLWQLLGAGYDSLDVQELDKRQLKVCTAGGANAIAVAEHAVMLMLAVFRRLTEFDQQLRAGEFAAREPGAFMIHELYRKRVGILGLGAIGQEVARRVRGFGCSVQYSDLQAADSSVEAELGATRVSFDELLATSDVISLHLPLNAHTRGMFDTEVFDRCKPGSILINTARGPIVDEAALIQAIESGRLLGAGLDVFNSEPPGSDDPLWELGGRIVVSPHIAGPTWESWPRRFQTAFDNIERVSRAETPRYLVSGIPGPSGQEGSVNDDR